MHLWKKLVPQVHCELVGFLILLNVDDIYSTSQTADFLSHFMVTGNYMETEFEICAENRSGRRYYFQRYGFNGKTVS